VEGRIGERGVALKMAEVEVGVESGGTEKLLYYILRCRK